MSRLLRHPAAACAVAALFAACSKSPSEKEVVDSMISWIGTADLAAQAWLNHTTFDRYTRETLELSAKALREQADQLKEVATHDTSFRDSPALDSAVAGAGHNIGMMAGLIFAKDTPDVQAQLDSLRAAKKIVLAVADTIVKRQQ